MSQNWSKNFTFEASEISRPTSVEELQETIAAAESAKAVGTRHCFNRIADQPGGMLIDSSELELSVEVDHEQMTATVPAGWSYSKVAAALESEHVALRNLASLPHVSVAGATATGTHGSGDTNQVMSAEISGIELVDGSGELRRVGRADADLNALAIGLGAFGVFTRITLDVEPTYLVQQEYYRDTAWATLLEHLDDIMASAYSVNLHAKFGEANISGIWRKHRLADATALETPDIYHGMTKVPGQLEAGKHTTLHVPGPWSERLAHFLPESAPSAGGDELQSEYFVDREHGREALNALRALGARIDPHLHGSEIRTVAPDELWLSPAWGRDTLSIGFTWKKHLEEVVALLPDVEAALAPFDARPHWGKLFHMGRSRLLDLFPKLDQFFEVADRYDPNRTFSNPYLDRIRG